MGMTTYIKGILKEDKEFLKMKEVYIACKEASIEIPDVVNEYFDYKDPRELDLIGKEIDLDKCTKIGNNDYSNWIEVDLVKIPQSVRIVRFYMSW